MQELLSSNFCRSLEMLLINCKVEVKLKLTKYCVLSVANNENDIKARKLYILIETLSGRDNQKLSKLQQRVWKISLLEWIWNKKGE